MSLRTLLPAAPALATRCAAIDKVRGLAVVCMVVDHVTLVLGGPEVIRLTVGRLAMPLFFLIAGHLFRRVSWRHAGVYVVGLALPLLVPWVDSPNVLEWYVLGCLSLALMRWADIPRWIYIAAALALAANGFRPFAVGTSYDGWALMALMCLGASMPRTEWAWAERLPRLLAPAGRFPLSTYVGHVLVLQGIALTVLT